MAFDLALKGLGHTSPNPLVGAVLVKDNKIIGCGFHQKYGSSPAEVNAINDAKTNGFYLEGATLYCNLEPNPSVAEMIHKEKISRVMISEIDPNLKVSRNGVEALRSRGIEAISGVLSGEGAVLNEIYFKFITTNTPFVHVLDGCQSLKHLHFLRQKYDCVIVDRKTIELDNPNLISESTEFEKKSHPLRLVVGSLRDLNPDWNILSDEFKRNTMMVATDDEVRGNPEVVRFLESIGVALLSVRKTNEGKVDIKAMLKSLASLKMTSLLVEGGADIVAEFLNDGLADELN